MSAVATADTDDHGSSLGAQLVALREVHAFKTGDLAAALEMARRAITLDFDDAPQERSATCCHYGSALYFSGSTHDAQAAFRRAVQLAEKIGDRRRRIYALGYLALIAAESGQLADAEHQIRRATGGRGRTVIHLLQYAVLHWISALSSSVVFVGGVKGYLSAGGSVQGSDAVPVSCGVGAAP